MQDENVGNQTTHLSVVRGCGSISDNAVLLSEDPARFVAGRRGRGAKDSQTSPAEDN